MFDKVLGYGFVAIGVAATYEAFWIVVEVWKLTHA